MYVRARACVRVRCGRSRCRRHARRFECVGAPIQRPEAECASPHRRRVQSASFVRLCLCILYGVMAALRTSIDDGGVDDRYLTGRYRTRRQTATDGDTRRDEATQGDTRRHTRVFHQRSPEATRRFVVAGCDAISAGTTKWAPRDGCVTPPCRPDMKRATTYAAVYDRPPLLITETGLCNV